MGGSRWLSVRRVPSLKTGLNDGEYHLFVGGRDPDGFAFISVDGETVGTTDSSAGGDIAPMRPIYIGALFTDELPGGASMHFEGEIDDVRVYDHALSVSEIRSLYTSRQQ
jgi:hypothetical protein